MKVALKCMRRDPRKLLYDIATAADAVAEFCRNKSRTDYDDSGLLRSACERQLEIVGEAMSRLRTLHPDIFSRIDRGRDVIDFRNRLIHGYDAVDSAIVWEVIEHWLPPLVDTVRDLIRDQR